MSDPLYALLYAIVLIPGLVFMFLRTAIAYQVREDRTKWSVLTSLYIGAFNVVATFYAIDIYWPFG